MTDTERDILVKAIQTARGQEKFMAAFPDDDVTARITNPTILAAKDNLMKVIASEKERLTNALGDLYESGRGGVSA